MNNLHRTTDDYTWPQRLLGSKPILFCDRGSNSSGLRACGNSGNMSFMSIIALGPGMYTYEETRAFGSQ